LSFPAAEQPPTRPQFGCPDVRRGLCPAGPEEYLSISTYLWTIGNGTLNPAQGTSAITFTATTAGTPLTLSVMVAPAGSAIQFYTVQPCRVADTR
jgi:hypothetical protein